MLIDEARRLAEEYRKKPQSPQWLKEDCSLLIHNLKSIRSRADRAALDSSGALLGIGRFLSESDAPLDLYKAGLAVGTFFAEKMDRGAERVDGEGLGSAGAPPSSQS